MQKKRSLFSYSKFAFVFLAVLFLTFSVFAEGVIEQIEGVSNETRSYIENFISDNNIQPKEVDSITPVDLENPPEEVKIQSVDEEANIAIYQVNYTENNAQRKVYIITYATSQFISPANIHGAPAIEYLHFGESGLINGSAYLKTASNIRTSDDAGYVMIDSGSITGLSTNIELIDTQYGEVVVTIYKNGEATPLRNIFIASSGVQKDYDKQSPNSVKFSPGDVISARIDAPEGVQWKSAITLLKLELRI